MNYSWYHGLDYGCPSEEVSGMYMNYDSLLVLILEIMRYDIIVIKAIDNAIASSVICVWRGNDLHYNQLIFNVPSQLRCSQQLSLS